MSYERQVAAAILQLNVAVEKSAMNALNAIGLKAGHEGVALAEKQMAEESPLYVKTVVLRGRMCRDMYDEHPGFAYFYTDALESVDAPPYCSLSKAMHLSVPMLTKAQQEIEDEYDGQFSPSSIVLLDQFGEPLQEYVERYLGEGRYSMGWLEDLPPEEEWAAMEERAKALDSEGSYETGWDNFETGRQLHAQAASLRCTVQMAKSRSRIIL